MSVLTVNIFYLLITIIGGLGIALCVWTIIYVTPKRQAKKVRQLLEKKYSYLPIPN